MQDFLQWFGIPMAQAGTIISLLLLGVAYITYMERKIISFMQDRIGPNRVGYRGLLQPIADTVKLLLKEDLVPRIADRPIYFLAPVIAVLSSIGALAVIPFAGPSATVELFGFELRPYLADVNVGLLYVLSISSIGVFGIVLGGWASNSKYPLLGGLRSAAQMVSYEVPFGLALIGAMMIAGTASMVELVEWQRDNTWMFVVQPVALFLFYIAGVAENNRAPFDLPEAETELVAGFHTEYSGMRFAFFFLAEYIAMVVVSAIVVTVFLGGWLPVTFGLGYLVPGIHDALAGTWGGPVGELVFGATWFALKTVAVLWVYLWLRATFPRYRYDQLMAVGWKVLIPLSLAWIMATGLVLLFIDRMAG